MRNGFSLLELSIVLVIIGLLVSGVMVGQNLVKQAEFRGVIVDVQKFQTAIMAFKSKYNAIPGDMRNATAYWGAEDGDNSACSLLTTPSTGTATCNGNGNLNLNTTNGGATYHERFRAWQHLSNAGLMEGSFSGVPGPGGGSHAVIGTNSPRSSINGLGFGMNYTAPVTSDAAVNDFIGPGGNNIVLGQQTSSDMNWNGAIDPEDAWQLDQKLDDGRPGFGRVRSPKFKTNCHTTNVTSTAEYDIGRQGMFCTPFFYF